MLSGGVATIRFEAPSTAGSTAVSCRLKKAVLVAVLVAVAGAMGIPRMGRETTGQSSMAEPGTKPAPGAPSGAHLGMPQVQLMVGSVGSSASRFSETLVFGRPEGRGSPNRWCACLRKTKDY